MRDLADGMRLLACNPRLIAVTITSMVLINVQLAMNGFLTVTAIGVIGVTPATASIAFASAFGAAVMARLFWGWASDRLFGGDRLPLLAILCALAASASALIAVMRPAHAPLLIPVSMYLGFTGSGWNGVMTAALAEIGGVNRAGSALGLTLTAIFAASTVEPLLFGAIADHASLSTAWLVSALIALVGIVPAWWVGRTWRLPTA
jgi:sugar phosphate permease